MTVVSVTQTAPIMSQAALPPVAAPVTPGDSSVAGHSKAIVLSSALPPIAAKVVAKIVSGQFVPMRDLLADNMALCGQMGALPTPQLALPGLHRPRLSEIHSPLAWVSCFMAYVAVLTPDPHTRNLLTYGRLIVREAQRHNGPGWREYDKLFRQHAALNPSAQWNEVNASLHAATVLTYRSGPGQLCTVCHEPDHSASECAMMALEPTQSQPPTLRPQPLPRPALAPPGGVARRPVRPETLERICVSWNRGKCTFPNCQFRHICATCRRRGHKAKECEETAAASPYKLPPPSAGRSSAAYGGMGREF